MNNVVTKKLQVEAPVTASLDQKKRIRYQKRSCVDRRADIDRRTEYDLDYFTQGGPERRIKNDRRKLDERRTGWKRVRAWCSVYVGLD
jgi:hypothetical protein